jgi:spoIIIJ-associated protein
MRETEQTAKTVEEAIQQGLQILGAQRDEVEVEVLEEPSSGILGFGSKPAKIRLFVKEADLSKAQKLLENVLTILNLKGMVDFTKTDDNVRFEISGEDLGILIGHRGETLNALQFLLNVILNKGMEGKRVSCALDIEGYRARRDRTLQILAEKMAQKASTERRSISLEPMLPNERRIIHMALQNHPYVTTRSQGKEPLRRIVISPKESAKDKSGRGARSRPGQHSRSTSFRSTSSREL